MGNILLFNKALFDRDYSIYKTSYLKKHYRPLLYNSYKEALNKNYYDLAEFYFQKYSEVDDIIRDKSIWKKIDTFMDETIWFLIKPFYCIWYFFKSLSERL